MACANIQDEDYSLWNSCPADVLLLIFKYLDLETLTACFKVNKVWRDLGMYYCDHYKLWDKIVKDCLFNSGESFKQKSTMNSKEICLNALLWQDVSKAKRVIKDYYQMDEIEHIHVTKDTLIVVCKSCVKLLNVNNFTLIKTLDIQCADYQESTTLYTILSAPVPGVEECFALRINKKGNCQCNDSQFYHPIPKTTLYSVHDKGCYFFDESYTLWVFAPKCGRHLRLLGRYFGHRETVHSVTVHTTGVYIYLLNGSVLYVDRSQKNMSIIFRVNAPGWIFDLVPYSFDRFTLVYGTSESHTPSIYENKLWDAKVLVFPNLSTVTQHGDILLLGFNDGAFGIYRPSTMSTEHGGGPERRFRIQFSDQPPVAIREIEVHETFAKQTMFALIGNRIAKIVMSYPQFYDVE